VPTATALNRGYPACGQNPSARGTWSSMFMVAVRAVTSLRSWSVMGTRRPHPAGPAGWPMAWDGSRQACPVCGRGWRRGSQGRRAGQSWLPPGQEAAALAAARALTRYQSNAITGGRPWLKKSKPEPDNALTPRNGPGNTRNPENGIPLHRLCRVAVHRQATPICLPPMRRSGPGGLTPGTRSGPDRPLHCRLSSTGTAPAPPHRPTWPGALDGPRMTGLTMITPRPAGSHIHQTVLSHSPRQTHRSGRSGRPDSRAR
jgi:hypothetical protein